VAWASWWDVITPPLKPLSRTVIMTTRQTSRGLIDALSATGRASVRPCAEAGSTLASLELKRSAHAADVMLVASFAAVLLARRRGRGALAWDRRRAWPRRWARGAGLDRGWPTPSRAGAGLWWLRVRLRTTRRCSADTLTELRNDAARCAATRRSAMSARAPDEPGQRKRAASFC